MRLRYVCSLAGILAAIVLIAFVQAKPPAQGVCPIQPDTNVVFYGETGFGGVGTTSKSWIIHFFDWWKIQDASIKYVILDSSDVKTDCNLANYPNVKIYIQPGGNAYYQQNKLGSSGKNNINNYINSGRGYVGICAGFYYTAGDYYWQGSYYNWPDLLGRYPIVEGSITDIADYDTSPGYALTDVSGYKMIYYGGPTRGWRNTPSDFPGQALLNYVSIPGNLPASIKYNNMLLMSVHAEAYENDGISGLTTQQRLDNYAWFANAINNVAGTNFIVPLPPKPECNDNIDNDKDGLIDINDLGCADLNDNDESNCGDSICEASAGETWQTCSLDCAAPQCSDRIDNDNDGKIDYPNDPGCVDVNDNSEIDGPVQLFFDDFESGISGWTTSAVSGGNKWIASNLNPYQGSYHAQSQPMSTTEPASIMEKTISTFGYSNIKVSYYRKLVGLDIADEFKAKWFDGTSWNILEQTGSSSANDAVYVYKEFVLPSSASNNANFALKFECTAGAVSEYCRVDNVKISAG